LLEAIRNTCEQSKEVFLRILQYIPFSPNIMEKSLAERLFQRLAGAGAASFPLDVHPCIALRIIADSMPGHFIAAVLLTLDEEFFRNMELDEARDKP
jgi:hypothetical protein